MRLERLPVSFEHGRDHLAIAFAVTLFAVLKPIPLTGEGSKRIRESQVLPGLSFALLEEALRRSREMDRSAVLGWLTTQFQK